MSHDHPRTQVASSKPVPEEADASGLPKLDASAVDSMVKEKGLNEVTLKVGSWSLHLRVMHGDILERWRCDRILLSENLFPGLRENSLRRHAFLESDASYR